MDLDVSFTIHKFNLPSYIEACGTKRVSSDLSYAVWQYQLHGYVTNSMIIVNILHAFYVVDFFINEDWSEFTHSTEY